MAEEDLVWLPNRSPRVSSLLSCESRATKLKRTVSDKELLELTNNDRFLGNTRHLMMQWRW